MKHLTRSIVVSFALAALVAACQGSNAPAPECEAISERCHDVDPGSGPIHDCHEFAEVAGRTAQECIAMQAQCNAVCVASDAGTDAATE
jgi:hypothetical protein